MLAFLRSASLWIAVVLAIPTSLILLTWNTLPGEGLYPVKIGLEAAPRLAFRLAGSKTAADYEVLITDRRFSEATTLIKRDNSTGLTGLQGEIQQTANTVEATQNNEAKQKFVDNLIAYNRKLEQEKELLTTKATPAQQSSAAQPSSSQLIITPSPSQPLPMAQPTTTTTTTTSNTTLMTSNPITNQTVKNITGTQNQIRQIIAKLQNDDKQSRDEKDKQDKSGDHNSLRDSIDDSNINTGNPSSRGRR